MKKWIGLLLDYAVGVGGPPDRCTSPGPEANLSVCPLPQPPGPNTWYLGGGYGNTIGAYFQRDTTYRAGQGLHFGLDFAAPCGTPVDRHRRWHRREGRCARTRRVAAQLDAPTRCGLCRAVRSSAANDRKLNVGDRVTKGQVVGLSGDSFGTCHSAPHLHLEIRSPDYLTAYNPINLIDADWDSLALVGAYQRGFERDLEDPRRWQYPDDQPDTKFGGPLLNNYRLPWPPDWYRRR